MADRSRVRGMSAQCFHMLTSVVRRRYCAAVGETQTLSPYSLTYQAAWTWPAG